MSNDETDVLNTIEKVSKSVVNISTITLVHKIFGLTGGPSVTSGVLSAFNRTIETERGLIENLVQTDAAINPGNSDGPLVDVSGKVVAINTAIIPYAQGIGFAIPINSAKSWTDDIITEGSTKKPWLGIVGLSITREIARYCNLPMDHVVLVTRVAEGSLAEAAGMSDGDIILQISNVELDRIEDLVAHVHKKQVGERVRIYAFSNGRERFCELKLSEAP